MDKYKVCPSCGQKNSPVVLECVSCGSDLMGIEIVDDELLKKQSEQSAPEEASTNTNMVKICDCGTHNPASARKCSSCGEDISDIIPSQVAEPQNTVEATKSRFVLSTLDGEYAYEITDGIHLVGRENEMKEYLSQKDFVSRTHARITCEKGYLYITNLSESNGTFINNVRIKDSDPHMLSDGDEIGLCGLLFNGERQDEAAYFMVRIGECI